MIQKYTKRLRLAIWLQTNIDIRVFLEHSAVAEHPITVCVLFILWFSSRSDYAYSKYNNRSHARCVLATTTTIDDTERFALIHIQVPLTPPTVVMLLPRCVC